MFIHRPTRRFRKSVAGATLAAATLGMVALITAGDGITPPSAAVAETTGLSVRGAKVYVTSS
jgi:hypothetical protein